MPNFDVQTTTGGRQTVTVDQEDLDLAMAHNWRIAMNGRGKMGLPYISKDCKPFYLHRVIAERAGLHVNGNRITTPTGNKYDLRRESLRSIGKAQPPGTKRSRKKKAQAKRPTGPGRTIGIRGDRVGEVRIRPESVTFWHAEAEVDGEFRAIGQPTKDRNEAQVDMGVFLESLK